MDNQYIISSAIYVVSHFVVGIYLFFLKKTNKQAYDELIKKNEDLRKQSLAILDLISNPGSLPASQQNTTREISVPMEPYTPRDEDQIIYLDELLKKKKITINGYEICLDQTPR